MSELEEQLNSVLNNPEEMQKLMQMASSFLGGSEAPAALPAPETEPSAKSPAELSAESMVPAPAVPAALSGIPPEMMGQAMKLLKGVGGKSGKLALLGVMKPYLSEERSKKLERAIILAGILGAGIKLLDKDGGVLKRLGINGGAL